MPKVDFQHNLTTFFSRRPGLLDNIVNATAKGNYWKNKKRSLVSEMKDTLNCAYRGVRAILDLGIPSSR